MSRVPWSESQLFPGHVPTSIVGKALWKPTVFRTHLHRVLQQVRGGFISLRVLCSGDGPGGCSILSTSVHEHGREQGPEKHGIMVKALRVGQEGEWHHPEAEVHHLELTDVETLVSGCVDDSPCVNRAEFFHVALTGWGHFHIPRLLWGPRGLLGP